MLSRGSILNVNEGSVLSINQQKAYNLLNQYAHQPIKSQLEQAGIIHLFEIAFELS